MRVANATNKTWSIDLRPTLRGSCTVAVRQSIQTCTGLCITCVLRSLLSCCYGRDDDDEVCDTAYRNAAVGNLYGEYSRSVHALTLGSTTIRQRTFRLRHFVYRHFVYRHFVYHCIPACTSNFCFRKSLFSSIPTSNYTMIPFYQSHFH